MKSIGRDDGEMNTTEFIIVTGMCGAGKTRAVGALEDIGIYCVDNMPPKLLPMFAELLSHSPEQYERAAIVVDARNGHWFRDLFEALDQMEKQGCRFRILFLECDQHTLMNRYKETRRHHPLAEDNDNSLQKAIEADKELLKPLRARADYLIDTTLLSVAQLRERLVSLFGNGAESGMMVQCMSFGFKYGYPVEADLVLDVRCLPNPFYIDNLKHKTGLDSDVRDYVMESEDTQGFLQRMYALVDYLLPLYNKEGKSQLVIAIGCTGGKHRSVALSEELAKHIAQTEYHVLVNHRDIQKL